MLDAGCLPRARPQRAGSPGHYGFLLPFMSTWFSNRSSDRVTQRTSMLESTRELLICFRNTWNWSGARAQTGGGRLPPRTAVAQGGHLWRGAPIHSGPDASGQTEARTSWVSCPSAAAHATSDAKPSVFCTRIRDRGVVGRITHTEASPGVGSQVPAHTLALTTARG